MHRNSGCAEIRPRFLEIYWAGLDQLDIQYELSPGAMGFFFSLRV
jgi:hypothetical protein